MLLRGNFIIRISCTVLTLFVGQTVTLAQTPKTTLSLSSEQRSQLRDLGSRILRHAGKAGCKKNNCTLLVANFTGPSGSTSVLGMQLADAMSEQLAAQAQGIRIADRVKLQLLLEKERIPSKLLEDDNAARWLAMENSANVVLIGYLKESNNQLKLSIQLLDTRDFGTKNVRANGPIEQESFSNLGAPGDLDPLDPFGAQPAMQLQGDKNEKVLDMAKSRASTSGGKVTVPHCTYMPNPSYTEEARRAKSQGTVILLAVIPIEGQIRQARIQKGLPFGLNQSALETVRTWKCEPATFNSKPVPIEVPIEVNFRLY